VVVLEFGHGLESSNTATQYLSNCSARRIKDKRITCVSCLSVDMLLIMDNGRWEQPRSEDANHMGVDQTTNEAKLQPSTELGLPGTFIVNSCVQARASDSGMATRAILMETLPGIWAHP
jgi:hypothetical protein